MAWPSWKIFGNFKNGALSKFEFLCQWPNFLRFKYILKVIEDL